MKHNKKKSLTLLEPVCLLQIEGNNRGTHIVLANIKTLIQNIHKSEEIIKNKELHHRHLKDSMKFRAKVKFIEYDLITMQ